MFKITLFKVLDVSTIINSTGANISLERALRGCLDFRPYVTQGKNPAVLRFLLLLGSSLHPNHSKTIVIFLDHPETMPNAIMFSCHASSNPKRFSSSITAQVQHKYDREEELWKVCISVQSLLCQEKVNATFESGP